MQQYCSYNGTAKVLEKDGIELLKVYCPHFVETEAVEVCCDKDQVTKTMKFFEVLFLRTWFFQIEILNKNVKMAAGFLKRCPSCLKNLVRHLCEFTCSPNQSTFLQVKSIEVNKETKREYVSEVDLHISEDYINGTYESCKQVLLISF